MIKRTAEAGSRRLFYELETDCWTKVIEIRLQQVERGKRIAEEGLKLNKGNPRLLGMHDLYARFEELLRTLQHL